MMEPTPFDIAGALPGEELAVLQASAGTGKTFTIAALAARYLAAGIPVERLLVVTFTRAATSQLRERVRQRIISTRAALASFLATGQVPVDRLDQFLSQQAGTDVEESVEHLGAALADFDAVTITTTHGFCQQILEGLGTAGDLERDSVFTEDTSDLVNEAVDDIYLRRVLRHGDPKFTHKQARDIGQKVAQNPLSVLQPDDALEGSPPFLRYRFARRLNEELYTRKLRAGVITYDDQLTRLRDSLMDDDRGPTAQRRLAESYDVVLIDEFQDTDPIQWDIVREGFCRPAGPAVRRPTVILIGDPKQAIYSFRGADVHAYLEAVSAASVEESLDVNFRSDEDLVLALDSVFRGAELGPGISFTKVRAAARNAGSGLIGDEAGKPLRFRLLDPDRGMLPPDNPPDNPPVGKGPPSVTVTRPLIAEDLAADVVRLLCRGTRIREGSEAGSRGLCAGDIAVLVKRNAQAEMVQKALEDRGVPAVVSGAGSVFGSKTAGEWLQLLRALEKPSSASRVKRFALTDLGGWSAERLAGTEEPELDALHSRLRRWAETLDKDGVASLQSVLISDESLAARLLRTRSGSRKMTDLRHVGELLHAQAVARPMAASGLAVWLENRIAEATGEVEIDERTRRLESDSDAVQVLTVHRSKGLEFPVVYLPYLWNYYERAEELPVFHDPDNAHRRTIDVGGNGQGVNGHREISKEEAREEDLRLAYVALTRAIHQVVVWWSPGSDTEKSALTRLLMRHRPGEPDASGAESSSKKKGRKKPGSTTTRDVASALELLSSECGHRLEVEYVSPDEARLEPSQETGLDLAASRFTRRVDMSWRRTSFSALTARLHDDSSNQTRIVSSEPEEQELDDEGPPTLPVPEGDGIPPETAMRDVPSPMSDIPGGTRTGTLVHSVLEDVDFASPRLDEDLRRAVSRGSVRFGVAPEDCRGLPEALRSVLETPLGPSVSSTSLRRLVPTDRLNELDFELPLCGGDDPTGSVGIADIAGLLDEHLSADDPLAGYGSLLRTIPGSEALRGFMTGSIDLVMRQDGERYWIVDYKTNRLGSSGTPLTAWQYRPAALVRAMQEAHYPLQALVYLVALHRFLRWRLEGYDPRKNLAGAMYLFLRGMSGPETPVTGGHPAGVFTWQPPVDLVVGMSDMFGRLEPR